MIDEVFRALEDGDNTAYVLSPGLRIVCVNAAWTRFAIANGGASMLPRWGAGASILDATPTPLRDHYRDLHREALDTGEVRTHDYECSSATVERRFRMFLFPLLGSFLVVTHALRVERPHDRPASTADEHAYRHDGIMTMCAYCRRVRARTVLERWDWVPAFVEALPAQVSHGLCPPCASFYFPA